MPFQDPLPHSTEPDDVSRRFQEVELPDPYIWLYNTASQVTSTVLGAGTVRLTWSTCSTRFPPVGFSRDISTRSPVVPKPGLYTAHLSVWFETTAAVSLTEFALDMFRLPYNSTTPQLISQARDVRAIPVGTPAFCFFSESVTTPFLTDDRLYAELYGVALTTGSTFIPLTVSSGEARTYLMLAGLGQGRQA